MLSNILPKLKQCRCLIKAFSTLPSTESSNTSLAEPRQLQFPPKYQKPRQVWLENFDTVDEIKLGLLDLHPDVFGVAPRIDIIHQNVRWQQLYRFVSFAHTKVRSEVRGGGRKPWPQKGELSYLLLVKVEQSPFLRVCKC